MSKFDHYIYVPDQLAEKFSTDRSYEECMFDAGINWYLFLVEGVNEPRILWVNSETANVYLMGIDTTADEIEDYIIEEIESHLTDRPFEHVTLRNNKRHIKWHQYKYCRTPTLLPTLFKLYICVKNMTRTSWTSWTQ